VPILLATSPLAAVRSVPTITQLTRPRCIRWPAMLSVISVTGIRSFLSSQAVSRAPCRKGRVSHEITWMRLPASTAAPTLASAAQGPGAQRDPHGGRDADRRRAADHHVLDGARHLPVVAVDAIDLARRQHALVEHDHAAASPFDRPDGHREARPPCGAYPNRL